MSNARNLARLLPNSSGQLPTGNLQDLAVTNAKIAANAVVVQTQEAYQTAAWSTSSTGYVDFLTVTLTPSKATNRIVIHGNVLGGSGEHSQIRVTRNGTEVPNATWYDGYSAKSLTNSMILQGFANNGVYGGSFSFVDTPNTTGAVTYRLQIAARTTGTVTVGRNSSGNTGFPLGQNYLQAVEMAG